MRNTQKIKAILIATLMLLSFMMVAIGDTAQQIQGTFDAAGNLSITVDTPSPDYTTINAGSTGSETITIENDGDVTADVTQDKAEGSNTNLTLQSDGDVSGTDEYQVFVSSTEGTGSDVDIGASGYTSGDETLADNLPATGSDTQAYFLNVTISSDLGAESYADETFYANLTGAVAT